MTQIHTAFGAKDPTPAIRVLLDRKIAVLETSAQRAVGDKTERLAVLNMPAEEAMELVASRRKRAPLRYAVTELLCTLGAASTKELCYFTGASPATLRSLEKSGILTLEKHEVLRRVRVEDVEPAGPVELNQEQEAAFRGLDRFCLRGEAGAALLYGVTGSGKTQIYIRLIQEVLARGQTAMVLVPEISLTPQLLRVFASHFGELVAVLHSSLRSGERYDEWKRVRSGRGPGGAGHPFRCFCPSGPHRADRCWTRSRRAAINQRTPPATMPGTWQNTAVSSIERCSFWAQPPRRWSPCTRPGRGATVCLP